ncbi:hypothetical protein ACFY4C_33490 [Actinomadura viridis]|uniref:hypothetical protein n=1 Tax=Actinomadura viridis TaxID=58110 RepID=UPI0036BBB78F
MTERPWDGALPAAAHLLAEWLPREPGGSGPAWRLETATGRTHAEPWGSAPGLDEVAAAGGFPGVFGGRHPVAVEPLVFEEGREHFPAQRASIGRPDDAAGQVLGLLTRTLGEGAAQGRVLPLLRFLAGELTAWPDCDELVRIQVAVQPGGPPLDGELHLLARGFQGETRRLSVAPAAVPPEPGPRDAETRLRCVETLLSEFLWVNNNNTVDFHTVIEPHGLTLDLADPDAADAAFRAGWKGSGSWELPTADGPGGELERLRDDEFADVLAESERAVVEMALASMFLEEGEWEDPEIPGDHLPAWLLRELVGIVTERVAGGAGMPLVYAAGLPFAWDLEGACLVLAGPERTAVIDIDDGC